jgi:sister chromatid cohesion protein DCC1
LPTYTSTGHYNSGIGLSKSELFAHTPVSDGECERSWLDLCCFELDGVAVMPSESVKLAVWQLMLEDGTAEGFDLTEALGVKQRSTLTHVTDEWPEELCRAFLESVAASPSNDAEFRLDPERLARLVGTALLRDRTDEGRRPMALAEFLRVWANLMPEKWRNKADIALLEDYVRKEDNGNNICLATNGSRAGDNSSTAGPTDAKSTVGAKRKWHEKFRASKKAA